jgi:hypothetical protein
MQRPDSFRKKEAKVMDMSMEIMETADMVTVMDMNMKVDISMVADVTENMGIM